MIKHSPRSKSRSIARTRDAGARIVLRSVAHSHDEAIVISDACGHIIFWNPGAEAIFGYSEKQILGKPLAPLLISPGNVIQSRTLERILVSKAPSDGKTHELRGIRANGRQFPADMSLLTWTFGEKSFFTTIIRDITERKRLQKEILEISAKEQQRIGQDLHDDLCQHLTAITLLTEVLEEKLKQLSLPEAKDAREIATLLTDAIIKTKSLAKGLLPVELEALGLTGALNEMAYATEKMLPISCRMLSRKPVFLRDDALAVHLYRIAQEAVNNALKHAQARHIEIRLDRINDQIVLSVSDDGIGFAKDVHSPGLGLSIMHSRAETIDAVLTIRPRGSNGTHGTLVTCSVREFFRKANLQRRHFDKSVPA